MTDRPDVLVIGFGNAARGDDGLGPALAEEAAGWSAPGVAVETDYQLSVEHAHAAAGARVVIFADAETTGDEPFSFRPVEPGAGETFSTHSLSPAAVMALARDLFGATTQAYLLGVRGYEFAMFTESLSRKARANLEAAARFLRSVLRDGSFHEAANQRSPRDCCTRNR